MSNDERAKTFSAVIKFTAAIEKEWPQVAAAVETTLQLAINSGCVEAADILGRLNAVQFQIWAALNPEDEHDLMTAEWYRQHTVADGQACECPACLEHFRGRSTTSSAPLPAFPLSSMRH